MGALSLIETFERLGRAGRGRQSAFAVSGPPVAWGALWRQAEAVARRLIAAGAGPGERVVLAAEAPETFLPLFLGTLRAAAVAVPVLPGSGAERLADVAALCGAAAVVAEEEPAARWAALAARAAAPERQRNAAWRLLSAGDAPAGSGAGSPRLPPPPGLADLALLQLTSGSTGAPKAVRIRHGDLAVNAAQMVAGLGITPHDVFVSWLPLHHDMGLVLMALVPLLTGARLHLARPGTAGLRGWLGRIAALGGTFTAAPDFAYRLALRLERRPGELDLSTLRVALDAAEPVRASTVERFLSTLRLAPVVVPAYGLAEATVGVSAGRPGDPVRVDERGFVCVGRPFPGVDLAIRGDQGLVAAGEVGEILVRGPAVTAGYWGEATPGLEARWHGWLRTGDLGHLDAAGRLTVVGRRKEVILQAGQTLAPREVEEAVDRLPAVRRSVAVGIDRGRLEGEQAYVFVEPERGAVRDRPGALAAEVARTFEERLGLRAGRVYVLAPGAIPRTANGKVRYGELRRLYLDGELRRQGALLFPDY